MVIVGPNGVPISKRKGSKTRISPQKRKIAYAELLAIICGVSKKSILKYFSNDNLSVSNPRAIKKWLIKRYEKLGSFEGKDKKRKTRYKREEKPIQGPSSPNIYKPKK